MRATQSLTILARRRRGFAISEMILTVTTATIVIGTALTSLTVYMSVIDEGDSQPLVAGYPAAILPAPELSMEATLLHLELQERVHEADLCYVIGGNRAVPKSDAAADFQFNPPIGNDDLHDLDELDSLAAAPSRVMSSHVMTQLLKSSLPDAFTAVSDDEALYAKRNFCILTVMADRSVTSITTQDVRVEGSLVVLDTNLYHPLDDKWTKTHAYVTGVSKEAYDIAESSLSFGATHYWARHDDLDPTVDETANSLWNRYEEGFCRVEFPDNIWNLEEHPPNTALTSKFTYFLPVVR